MQVLLKLTGMTGMVMHNPQLVDPENEFSRAIKEITSKGSKQTDADRAEVARLEWYGGIYHDPDLGCYVPTWNIIKCLNRAGTITKKGTAILQAVAVTTDKVPLQYDGPRDLTALWERPEFRWKTEVGIGMKKIMRMRPIFRRWSVELEAEMLEDVLNPADFEAIAHLAGRTQGLGDARKLGYGRFGVEIAR